MSSDLVCSWTRPLRKTGEISVLHVDLTPGRIREDHALAWLDKSERERWERYRTHRSKREFALCRAALRHLLCEQLGCENSQLSFAVTEHGKPHALVNQERVSAGFSVSHSAPHGLITIREEGRVGADIETGLPERDFEGIARKAFSPNERAEIISATGTDKARLFFRFWTLKEALGKALGTGLSAELTDFELPSALRGGASRGYVLFPGKKDTYWVLENLSTPDYVAAIASEI